MSDLAIVVENLGKKFTLHHQLVNRSNGLRHLIEDAARAPFRWVRSRFGTGQTSIPHLADRNDSEQAPTNPQFPPTEDFWALKDVSFKVEQGEVLGIIGRNGAGKSTLLKILSRITEPTNGRVELAGRVASLLEVGTGFHPELTGRENVYLNGAILGMTRAEIQRKFDAIVDFSGVEKFLDTPVKHFSSGMRVRLAFAVAAHLEPEILIVDEVLAVGDAGFQKKCLGKMEEVAGQGRTVLLVSHQMSAIERLCQRSLVLDGGQIVFDGSVSEGIDRYLTGAMSLATIPLGERRDRQGLGHLRFTQLETLDAADQPLTVAKCGSSLKIRLHYRVDQRLGQGRGARFSVAAKAHGTTLFLCSTELCRRDELVISTAGAIDLLIPNLPLSNGSYSLTIYAEASGDVQDWLDDAAQLSVEGGHFFESSHQTVRGYEGKSVLVAHEWSLVP